MTDEYEYANQWCEPGEGQVYSVRAAVIFRVVVFLVCSIVSIYTFSSITSGVTMGIAIWSFYSALKHAGVVG